MIRVVISFLLIFILASSWSQILRPATWTFETSVEKPRVGDEIELIFLAEIDEKWYLYSSDFDPDLGPMVTEFEFLPDESYKIVGDIRPVNPKKAYDKIFEGDYTYFKGKGEFRQKIKVLSANLNIRGSVSYQVCSDIDGKCIPFDDDFDFIGINVAGVTIASSERRGNQRLDSFFKNPKQSTETGFGIPGTGILKPASWNYEPSTNEAETGDELELIFYAYIDKDWYLYSTDFDPDLGPMVTQFSFNPDPSFELIGEIEPIDPKTKYDSTFEGDYTYFKGKGEFRQKIRVLSASLNVKGSIEYQVCSEINGKCIPLEEDFEFAEFSITGKPIIASKANLNFGERSSSDPYSLLAFMILAFLAGLAAILTPCVFPMIPVTVSFFTKGAGKEGGGKFKALFYGFSIILIYTIVGVGVSLVFGADVANDMATSATANIIFFAVFVFFGLSFLGMFEITLPNSFINAMDRKADKGGVIGILFMAFTLVLVSFSCTGPIVGSILVESAGGNILKPVLGMFAFSMAFAIPFTLFAFFPSWLSSLPKSGGWLNSVKVVLGFLELALSLKFLSIADQVYHWGILDREVYLALWIVILLMLGFYLLGKIRMPGDSVMESVSVPRLLLAISTFSFVAYLIPGMFGAPLKAMAGYLPPLTSHDFNVIELINQNNNSSGGAIASANETLCDDPKYADFLKFPHGIKGYFDYKQAITCAREQNKPLFIDFTGHGCVNCREMEARVWSDPLVLQRLKNDFIMVALYVDDRKELPESNWYTSSYDGKQKKTIGKQNADFQITRFGNNAQPYYVILNNDEQILMQPTAYNLNVSDFVKFLDQAKDNYENKSSLATN